MEKNLLKLLTVDREIRLFVVDVTKVLRFSALRAMRAEPARQLYVKIFANCALLRGLLTPEQRATVAVRFKPEGYSAHCEIDGHGAVHCLFSPKLCSFDGDVADLVGEGATLSMTRGSWTGGMFTGTVELTQHAVDDFFSYFYSKSEQTETVFMTWTDAAPFRGCMVQPSRWLTGSRWTRYSAACAGMGRGCARWRGSGSATCFRPGQRLWSSRPFTPPATAQGRCSWGC